MRRLDRARPRPRRGVTIVPTIVALLLITVVCGSLLKVAGAQRGMTRAAEREAQADWLAESALGRAAARLAADRKFTGERWEVAPEEFGGGPAGLAVIEVSAVADRPDQRRVRVVADSSPGDDTRRHRRSKTLTLDLGPETPGATQP